MLRRLPALVTAAIAALGAVIAAPACNGTTGDELISFTPYAAGAAVPGEPSVAAASQPFRSNGYEIQLTSASMYIGAVYFDESPPSTSFDAPVCNTSDVFAAQVPGGVLVNLLSTDPQEFSVYGSGSADVAESWDIWLTSGDINQPNVTPTATLTGTATLLSDRSKVYSFGAIVGINPGQSGPGARGVPVSNPALPGADPICKSRILQLGGLDLSFYQGGTLRVTVDPRGWFAATSGIDFANLQPIEGPSGVCDLDVDSTTVYESRGPCSASHACASGLTCAAATDTCVRPCDADGACDQGFVCNTADDVCMVQYCIPDTNWAACPSTDPDCGVTSAAAAAGESLFLGILGGGSSAYQVSYTGSGATP